MPKRYTQFINREISWLHFNERVLQEAADESTPLIERIKFLGIFSNNLDEFFRVRVATLNRMADFKDNQIYYGNFNPTNILKEIYRIDRQLHNKFEKIYQGLIKKLREEENICLINEKQLTPEQGGYVKRFFHEKVRPELFPLMLLQLHYRTMLKDKSIYLAVHMFKSKGKKKDDNYALIKVPIPVVSRFVILPEENGKKQIIILDDVIRYCLEDIFYMFDYDEFEAFTVKFTRDAELDIDNDVQKSFMEVMAESLEQRKEGQPVRFIYDENMPETLLNILTEKLQITEKDKMSSSGRYHNFKDFMKFPNIGGKHLEHPKLRPLLHKDLYQAKSIFNVIRKKDVMLHFPYQSFQYVIDWLREASIDPKVKSIKITIYRLAKNSSIINSLINAARNGKVVTAFMELQARFDEKANIYWSEKLQKEGVRIIHGIPGLKVHSKLILIKRKVSKRKYEYFSYIGTGNFNEETARIYADNALITSNPKISQEVDKVFGLFENHYKPVRFQQLIVSPVSQRKFFIRMINREINFAKEGKKAQIIIKLNNIVDEIIARKIYQAGEAGVDVKLIVRGICILKPGLKGVSENIEGISIVDKFLEHSRIIYFYNDGDEKFFISSADWMVRNFDHRIEVGCPIHDKQIQQELKKMLDIQLKDNTKARLLGNNVENKYKKTRSKKKIRSQVEFYNYLKEQFENSIKE